MSVTHSSVVAQRHRRVGPYETPGGRYWAADCSCGWTGSLHGTESAAIREHDKHRSDPKARVR